MHRNALTAVALAALLVLAGCAGTFDPADGGTNEGGTVNFYVSDEQNAIEDFEHLNVTFSKVGIHRVGEDNESGEWIEKDVDNVTVDLTELQGENATQLEELDAPNGTYDKVFIHVAEVEGTLESGEQVNVKLPSEKLHVNEEFTVGNGEAVDFVFDVSVFKAGDSGKYILKPVVSESGTDVDIDETDSAVVSEGAASQGAITLYLSDEENAIDEFEHVNVTITKVGVHRVGEDNESGDWIETDVDNRTIDVTKLLGDNATQLDVIDAPNGTYDKVFIHVSAVEGTLKTGEEVNVKLPSNKLHVNEEFTVGDGEAVDFVFDVSVFKAGNSGKYILKPVVSESGTDVDIEETDVDDEARNESENETDDADAALDVAIDGEVAAGENVTVTVTDDGEQVENATVSVDGEVVGETDADGQLVVTVPEDAEELEVEAVAGDREGEVTREIKQSTDADDADDSGGAGDDNASLGSAALG